MLENELRYGFLATTIIPAFDHSLAFSFFVPRGWQQRTVTITKDQLAADGVTPVQIAEFADAAVPGVAVEISYLRSGDVNLEGVIDARAAVMNATVMLRTRGEFDGRGFAEALLRDTPPGSGPRLVRVRATTDGALVFVIAAGAPETLYPRYKRALAVAVISVRAATRR